MQKMLCTLLHTMKLHYWKSIPLLRCNFWVTIILFLQEFPNQIQSKLWHPIELSPLKAIPKAQWIQYISVFSKTIGLKLVCKNAVDHMHQQSSACRAFPSLNWSLKESFSRLHGIVISQKAFWELSDQRLATCRKPPNWVTLTLCHHKGSKFLIWVLPIKWRLVATPC